MIVINTVQDVKQIKEKHIAEYIENLVKYILDQYNDKKHRFDSLERIGAIFFIESFEDLDNYKKFGLSSPITDKRFESIDDIGEYCNGTIVINNEFTITLIGKSKYFEKFKES